MESASSPSFKNAHGNWIPYVVSAICSFFIYEIYIRTDQLISESPMCDYPMYSNTVYSVYAIQSGCFLVILCIQVNHFSSYQHHNIIGSILTSACVSFIACLSSLLTLLLNWGGICEDAFGVRYPGALWGEWVGFVPLIFYMVIATENKRTLTTHDRAILFFITFGMILGSSLNFTKAFVASVIIIIFALSSVCISLFLMTKYTRNYRIESNDSTEDFMSKHLSKKCSELTLNLLFFIPIFPIIYFLSLTKVISHDVHIILIIVANILMKLCFVSQILGIHIQAITIMHDAAVQLNIARRAFLRFIMYEIRIPLNSMTLGINLLNDNQTFNEDEREALIMIDSAADFMTETLNDVLNIQKIEEGKLELTYAPFQIHEIPKRIKGTLRGIAAEKSILLTTKMSRDIPGTLIGDVYHIEHVITNLVSNAIKFSPKNSEIVIEFSILPSIPNQLDSVEPKCTFVVSVTDNGPGISEADQRNLFQPFMQIRPGEMQQGGGTGVGLSLCKQIIQLHGGTIECISSAGRGSTFQFQLTLAYVPVVVRESSVTEILPQFSFSERTFFTNPTDTVALIPSTVLPPESESMDEKSNPLKLTDAPQASQKVSLHRLVRYNCSESNILHGVHHPGRPKRALVADGNVSNAKLMNMLLQRKGYICHLVQNGQEALAAVRANPDIFDIIFLENIMTVMNGIDTSKALRSMGYNKLIIGITGAALDDDVSEFITGGADKVLIKPLQPDQLDAVLLHVRRNGNLSTGSIAMTFREIQEEEKTARLKI